MASTTAASTAPRHSQYSGGGKGEQYNHHGHNHSHHHSKRTSQRTNRPTNPRRRTAPTSLSTSQFSADPEIMASLVESLSKIPSPQHPFFDGPAADFVTNVPVPISPRSPISPARDYHFLHPEDAALPPVVRTSKPSSHSIDKKNNRLSYTTEIPHYIRTYVRSESEDNVVLNPSLNSSRKSHNSSGTDLLKPRSYSANPTVHFDEMVEESFNGERSVSAEPVSPVERFIPKRASSHGKGAQIPGSSRDKGKRHTVHPTAIVTNASPLQLASPLHSPITASSLSPTSASASTAKTATALKRQSSVPHSSPPVTNHRRSASGKLRRRSSPPTLNPVMSPPLSDTDDRASNADSIDDAVEAYLCSPRLSQKLRLPESGRVVSFSEVGDPNGYAVFVCVGMGLTRYVTAFYDDLALSLGLRLITPDRPGVGESEAIPESERTVLSWPDDVLFICQSLKITKFSIIAHSAGAIYALATALRMPAHIRGKIHLLAPWIPPSQMVAIGNQQGNPSPAVVPTSQRILRALPTPILKAANSSFMSATSSSLTSSLPKSPATRKKRTSSDRSRTPPVPSDRDTPTLSRGNRASVASSSSSAGDDSSEQTYDQKSPMRTSIDEFSSPDAILAAALSSAAEKERQQTYDERLTHAIWALATRNANPAVDLLVCLERSRPIGFRYVDIQRAVVIHHGTRDNRVPVDNIKWLGTTMRRCEVRILDGEGHGLMASASVMGNVLTEIAGEWKEWKRAIDGKGTAEQHTSGWVSS